MPFCEKCGNEISKGTEFCSNCGEPIKPKSKQLKLSRISMSNKIWYIIPILLAFIGSIIGYVTFKDKDKKMAKRIAVIGMLVSILWIGILAYPQFQTETKPDRLQMIPTSTPSPTITPSPIPSITPTPEATTEPIPTPLPTVTQTVSEEDRIEEMIDGYLDAYNRHAMEEFLEYYTDDVERLNNNGDDGRWIGQDEVRSYLSDFWKDCPDVFIEDVGIGQIDVSGNKATVQGKYLVSAILCGVDKTPVTENIELVKQNGVWKISKTDYVF